MASFARNTQVSVIPQISLLTLLQLEIEAGFNFCYYRLRCSKTPVYTSFSTEYFSGYPQMWDLWFPGYGHLTFW